MIQKIQVLKKESQQMNGDLAMALGLGPITPNSSASASCDHHHNNPSTSTSNPNPAKTTANEIYRQNSGNSGGEGSIGRGGGSGPIRPTQLMVTSNAAAVTSLSSNTENIVISPTSAAAGGGGLAATAESSNINKYHHHAHAHSHNVNKVQSQVVLTSAGGAPNSGGTSRQTAIWQQINTNAQNANVNKQLTTYYELEQQNGGEQAEQKLSPWDLLKLDPLVDHTPLVATLDD